MSQGFVNSQNIALPLAVNQGGTGVTSLGTGVITALQTNVGSNGGVVTQNAWAAYTPTITLVGGSGNTVPTFSTFVGRYCRVGNVVYVCLDFENSAGGTAGAGTGVFNVDLPIQVSSALTSVIVCGSGYVTSLVTTYQVVNAVVASATTTTFTANVGGSAVPLLGNSFSNAARYLQISFFYEV